MYRGHRGRRPKLEHRIGEINPARKLLEDTDRLSRDCEDLKQKEAEIRLELRKHGGHKAKVSDNVLHWLEHVDQIQVRANRLITKRGRNLGMDEKEVRVVSSEVNVLRETASSLLVFNTRNGVDNVVLPGDMPSQPLVGKMAHEVSNKIWEYLSDPKIGIIGLYGVGGVGKTTIMNNIKNQLANVEMFEKIIWVTVSEKARLKKVQDDIAAQLGIILRNNDDVKVRASIIYDHLKNVETCLFILDDVWRTTRLCEIEIPAERDGFKVVITTRSHGICTQMRANEMINLVPLSTSEAWDLFVSRSDDRVYDPEIQSIAEEIVCECVGIPLNIIAVGHAMKSQVDATAWRLALHQLRSTQRETRGKGLD